MCFSLYVSYEISNSLITLINIFRNIPSYLILLQYYITFFIFSIDHIWILPHFQLVQFVYFKFSLWQQIIIIYMFYNNLLVSRHYLLNHILNDVNSYIKI